MINVRKNLRDMVRKSGLEYKELAAKIGVSPKTLSHWFCRGSSMSVEHVELICKGLGVRAIDALTYPAKYVDSEDKLKECPLYQINPELFKAFTP